MKYRIIKIMGLMFALILGAASTYAVPAMPGLIKVKNKSGEEIRVRLIGDEHFHFYFSEDGYPLLEKNGGFTYCDISQSGKVTDSGIEISAPEKRSNSARAFLNNIGKGKIEKGLQTLKISVERERNLKFGSGRANIVGKLPYTQGPGIVPGTTFPAYGNQKVLVILVEFTDVKFRVENPNDYYHRMLNAPGFSEYGATGSAADYFCESSCGTFTPEFDVAGPVMLPHNESFYGGNDWAGNDSRPAEMVAEACRLLDSEIDFSEYDRDGDGYVDNVYVYYAGLSEASGGGSDCIWPHAWVVSEQVESPVLDGVKVNRYACSNEWTGDAPCGIGTFVHEFSHVLGLPDLYSTSYTGAFTPGAWSAMDVGPYNNEGRTPPRFSAFERYALGWINPVEINRSRNVILPDVKYNKAAVITTASTNEYFLIENRQQTGWDEYLPGHGMLVWHIDYDPGVWQDNRVNNIPYHQYVDIMEADGVPSYDNIAGDAFPGSAGVTSFTDRTVPALKTWGGVSIPYPITCIEEDAEGIIRFKVGEGGEKLPVPETIAAEEVSADSFIARWNKVEGSFDYLLSVASVSEDGGYEWLPGLRYKDVGQNTSFKILDLDERKEYIYTVIATDGLDYSDQSNEVKVVTSERTLEYVAAEACEAEEISHDSFTAAWHPTTGATDYIITVYTKKEDGHEIDTFDFGEGPENLPEGWISTSKQSYSMGAYSGEDVPALRLSQDNDYLQSCEYPDEVKSLSFWHRGNSTSADDCLEVALFNGKEWSVLSNIPVITEKGGTVTVLENIPASITAIRLTYKRAGDKGAVAIDDVAIGHGNLLVASPVSGFENLSVGNSLRYRITGLEPETNYYYVVYASDGEYKSKPSAEIAVKTCALSGVRETQLPGKLQIEGKFVRSADNDRIEVYDASGVMVADGKGEVMVSGRGVMIIRNLSNGTAIKAVF